MSMVCEMVNQALNLVTGMALAVMVGGCELRAGPPADALNAQYWIEGKAVDLVDGKSSTSVDGSAAKVVTRAVGLTLQQDLNADGREDAVFILTQETGGSGTFVYVVAAIASGSGYRGSVGYFLGDRIVVQSLQVGVHGSIVVTYLDRGAEQPFSSPPTESRSLNLWFDTTGMRFDVLDSST